MQNIFKMLHSPVCLRRHPQHPPTTGRALVSTTVPDNFHLKQLKVCSSTSNMSLSSALCKYSRLEKKALLGTVSANLCHYFSEDGVLSLFNITRETSGYYICTSQNQIGSASCNFTLAVMPGEHSNFF